MLNHATIIFYHLHCTVGNDHFPTYYIGWYINQLVCFKILFKRFFLQAELKRKMLIYRDLSDLVKKMFKDLAFLSE